MSQGICVVDAELRLVAWNSRYASLFDYPPELLQVLHKVADLTRYAVTLGIVGEVFDEDTREARVHRRLQHMRAGTRHLSERRFPDGTVVEIRGNPMPGGGFVATFTDVTAFRQAEVALKRINETLEQRVEERTHALNEAYAQLAAREEARAQLLRKLISAQEDERKRIARELHDETSQSLAVLAMGLEAVQDALRNGKAPRLDEVKALAVRTLEEVHRLILDLRPAVLDDLGLFSAIRWYAERYLSTRGIAVRCEIHELEHRLPPEVEIALFRIAQEAMNNIARHAKAESVLIQLAPEGRELRIEIEDDGQGFDPAVQPADRPHYGLLGIRERAELLGGTAVLDSAPGQGTRLEIRVPLPAGSSGPEHGTFTGPAPGLDSVAS
jgi:signal transduction histidine kinase